MTRSTAAQPVASAVEAFSQSPRGQWRLVASRLVRHRAAAAGLALITLVAAAALLAPVIAPYDPAHQDLERTFEAPSLAHPMGTDNLGRDWLSRLLYGARVSIGAGLLSQAIVVAIGVPLGLIAGYAAGRADNLLMRLTDLFYSFPSLLLLILLRSVLGGSLLTLFLIIGLVTWMDVARLTRGQALSLRQREFVEAARAMGASGNDVVRRHLLPNLIGPVIVAVSFGIPQAIFAEATLSFIGIGVEPGTPSWGSMVQEGYSAIFAFPHLVLFPSFAIALLVMSFTFLGDGLRDALDPRSLRAPPPAERDRRGAARGRTPQPSEEREQRRAA